MGLTNSRVCPPQTCRRGRPPASGWPWFLPGPAAGTVLAAVLFLVWGGVLYAQSAIPGQLGREIQNLEYRLSLTSISSAERHDSLVRLARLRQLSGNIAGAAANWLDAAALNSGNDTALVNGAYCLAAIGEWDRASLVIRPLLASGRRGPAMLQARYLDAFLRTWTLFDASALAALAGDPEFTALRPLIYYTLWQTAGRNPGIRGAGSAEHWKSRLLAEFPKSPEARVVNPGRTGNASTISAVQTPLWLLLPGTAAAGTPQPIPPPPPAQTTTPSVRETPVQSAPAQTKPAASAGTVLQTGLFSREANALAQSEALRKAGFSSVVTRKTVNGTERWAVAVPAGPDVRKTTQELKAAGYDSFPVN